MLKVRIIAIIIALVLTALTAYLVPIALDYGSSYAARLSEGKGNWLYLWMQVGVGLLIAAGGFWGWKKSKSKK